MCLESSMVSFVIVPATSLLDHGKCISAEEYSAALFILSRDQKLR